MTDDWSDCGKPVTLDEEPRRYRQGACLGCGIWVKASEPECRRCGRLPPLTGVLPVEADSAAAVLDRLSPDDRRVVEFCREHDKTPRLQCLVGILDRVAPRPEPCSRAELDRRIDDEIARGDR